MANNQYTSVECAKARAEGAKKYWPNEPCVNGHWAQKYTSDQSCVECKRLASIERRDRAKADPALASKMREWQRDAKRRKRKTADGRRELVDVNRRYNERNRESVRKYYRERRANDADFAMACWMRSALHRVLSRANLRKDAKAVHLLGYNQVELRRHIEAQFLAGMGWHNRHLWHIDHIVPVSYFIEQGETDPSVVNALSNLRPIWAKDNVAKSDNLLTFL